MTDRLRITGHIQAKINFFLCQYAINDALLSAYILYMAFKWLVCCTTSDHWRRILYIACVNSIGSICCGTTNQHKVVQQIKTATTNSQHLGIVNLKVF